jgi:TrmH family RNA methyltransferase
MPASLQITSTRNPLVKRIRALAERDARKAEGRVVIEGVRLIEDALAAGVSVEVVLYAPKAFAGLRAEVVIDQLRRQGVRLITATPQVVAACSHVETSQGLVAVVERPRASLAMVLTRSDLLLVVVDRVQDPGNLGTIVRIADAAGATAVLATRGTVDPFNPKAIRATMGSLFHLPIVTSDAADAIAVLRSRGVRILVADPHGSVDYTDADYRAPAAIVVGSEGQGPGPEWYQAAAATIRIPLYGRAESLNVAVAAGLLLYEVQRARRPHAMP